LYGPKLNVDDDDCGNDDGRLDKATAAAAVFIALFAEASTRFS